MHSSNMIKAHATEKVMFQPQDVPQRTVCGARGSGRAAFRSVEAGMVGSSPAPLASSSAPMFC
jgi:hypothetical protein